MVSKFSLILYYPTHFSVIKYRLYQVMQDSESKENTTHLLVLKRHREMLLHAAYPNPIAKHVMQDKALLS